MPPSTDVHMGCRAGAHSSSGAERVVSRSRAAPPLPRPAFGEAGGASGPPNRWPAGTATEVEPLPLLLCLPLVAMLASSGRREGPPLEMTVARRSCWGEWARGWRGVQVRNSDAVCSCASRHTAAAGFTNGQAMK